MKKFIFSSLLLSSIISLTACDRVKQLLPHSDSEKTEQPTETQVKEEPTQDNLSDQKIEIMVDNKIAESINFLNEESRRSSEDSDYYKYALNTKNIIKSDLNQDGKPDYVVEASFCEETNCHITTGSSEIFVFTTDQQDQLNFITDLNFGLDAKVTNISQDGVITIENHEYADDDPSCCPSITKTLSYALVGKKLALLATP